MMDDLFIGRVCFVCIGNELNGDDAFGYHLANKLKKYADGSFMVLFASTVPENFISVILNFAPEHVVVFDAGVFNGDPGQVCLLDLDSIENHNYSTHRMPMRIFSKMLEDKCIIVYFIGVQALNFGLGDPLSKEVEASIDTLVTRIQKARIDNI